MFSDITKLTTLILLFLLQKIKMNSSKNLLEEVPQTPIDIAFTNITYQVKIQPDPADPNAQKPNRKTIVNNLSGVFKAGKLTAIMGSSGAGKTTLINILAGRITDFSGKMYANNQQYDFESFGHFANYVMQSDILMQTLTVRQTLWFAASLKVANQQQIKSRVQNLSKKLKLQKCLDVIVGGPILKGISGGQKKRTSIAFQLISDPQVIALDQPTSGLDSLTSFIIINELKELSQAGKTVFLTIHQPANQIYELFDKLLLMVEGNIIYQDKASLALAYFQEHFNLVCPTWRNPAQFVIQITHLSNQTNLERIPKYKSTYLSIQSGRIDEEIKGRQLSPIVNRTEEVSNWVMLKTLLQRDLKNIVRNPIILKARIIQMIFIALLIGGVYWKIGGKDYTNITYWNAITGCLFFALMDIFFQATMPVALVFPLERLVFLKEENAKMYNVFAYFLSRNIIEIPYLILSPVLYIVVVYWMVGFGNTAEQFFVYYFILFLLVFAGSSAGLLFGSMIVDAKSISTVIPIVVLPMVLFSGFFKNSGNISKWTKFLEYVSPFKYAFIGSVINEAKYTESSVSTMNFDFEEWPAILMLLMLGVAARLLSLFFLWFKKGRIQ